MPKPPATLDIRDVQVIKDDRAFFMSDRFGDVPVENTAALGLYYGHTRFLARLELTLNELKPPLLHSSSGRDFSQIVELVYPVRMVDFAGVTRKDNISLQRSRVLSGSLYERLRIRNFGMNPRRVRVAIDFDADFLDLFEVRGFERERRGEL